MIPRLRAALPLAGIVVLAAALRFWAIGFGLPYPHARPDEETAVGHAVAILHGDPNPHFFNWPSLTLYVFAAALGVARSAGRELSAVDAVVLSRAVVAAAGTLTVIATAAIGRRLAGTGTAVAAALFLAVAPLHVRESHFAMTDVLMTLLLTMAMALAMRAREIRDARLFAAAGLVGGLATSTKYSAGVVLALAAAAPGAVAALLFVVSWAIGFVGATPFALLDVHTFAADVAFERAHLSAGHTVALGRGWIYHLQTTLPHGVGIAVAVAAAAGLARVLWKYHRAAVVPMLFAVAFYLSIGAGTTVFFRYALPLVPLACVCAAVAVDGGGAWLARRVGFADGAVIAACAALVAAPSFFQSMQLDRLLGREDSRVIAADRLAGQLKAEDTVHDSGGDYTRLWMGATAFHAWRYDPATRSFGDPAGATPGWIVLYESPLPEYTQAPESLRELVAARYALAFRVPGVPFEAGRGIYDRQDAFFLPIDGFTGVARPGPTVLIYRLRTTSH